MSVIGIYSTNGPIAVLCLKMPNPAIETFYVFISHCFVPLNCDDKYYNYKEGMGWDSIPTAGGLRYKSPNSNITTGFSCSHSPMGSIR